MQPTKVTSPHRPETVGTHISICRLRVDVLSVFLKRLFLRAQPCWFTLFEYEEQEKLVSDVMDTCAAHVGLVHDVIDTYCQTQNGSAYGYVSAIFKG